jgi:hypothetical protein
VGGMIDAGIRRAVDALVDAGIETFESCEGGGDIRIPGLLFAFTEAPEKDGGRYPCASL